MNLLSTILLGVLALNTTHDEIPDTTTVGEILNLGGYNATNAANWAIGRYDATNLAARINAKYTKPNTGIPMTDLKSDLQQVIYGKQDALVSGTNIKTINNQSILGPGNLIIEGGSGGTSNYEMLNNKPRIGGVEVVGNHPVTYYGGQTKISDYTTTNAVKSIVSSASVTNLGAKAYADGLISASNMTFSNAVLSVALNIDTNSVAVLNEIASTFGGFPITGTATTVGGLLAALAAAIAWLRKKKIDKITCSGVADITTENGTANVSSLFNQTNTTLSATITSMTSAHCSLSSLGNGVWQLSDVQTDTTTQNY